MLKLTMPTDNFYKFITFVGIALTVSAFTLLMNASDEIGRDAKEFFSETKLARQHMDQYISKANGFLKRAEAAGGIANLPEIEKQRAFETYRELTALAKEGEPLIKEGLVSAKYFERQIDQYAKTRSFYIALIYVGIAIFLIGAFFWYWKTQRPIDKQQSGYVAGNPQPDAIRIQTQ